LKITDYKWCKTLLILLFIGNPNSWSFCIKHIDFGNFFFTLIDPPPTQTPNTPKTTIPPAQPPEQQDDEENPHPTHLIGQLGYYAIALLTQSYILFFLALAANISNLTFLWLVETPHMHRRSSHESSSRASQIGNPFLPPTSSNPTDIPT
jgi:hypothetical protein